MNKMIKVLNNDKFKNKTICKEVLYRLSNGVSLSTEWAYVYNDVINYNMDLKLSIERVFMHPRGRSNHVDWAYAEFSKLYHGLITHYNYKHRTRPCII